MDCHGVVGNFIVEGGFDTDLFNTGFASEILPHVGNFAMGEPHSVVVKFRQLPNS